MLPWSKNLSLTLRRPNFKGRVINGPFLGWGYYRPAFGVGLLVAHFLIKKYQFELFFHQ